VDGLCATKSEVLGLIVRAISFQDFQLFCDHNPPTLQTDRQMDRQTDRRTDDVRSQDRTSHYSASRGKKNYKNSDSSDCIHKIAYNYYHCRLVACAIPCIQRHMLTFLQENTYVV